MDYIGKRITVTTITGLTMEYLGDAYTVSVDHDDAVRVFRGDKFLCSWVAIKVKSVVIDRVRYGDNV